MSHAQERPRVLVLARNFPNQALPVLGLWTERIVEASTEVVTPEVVAPIGYIPPGVPVRSLSRLRRIPRRDDRDGFAVHHPRVPTPPGYRFHRYEARLWYPFVRRVVDTIMEQRPASLIHAHFIYPEGVVAARLGRRYGIPVITTEQAMWQPWMAQHPAVRDQVLAALPYIDLITTVSEALRKTVHEVAGSDARTVVLPNTVDGDVFTPPPSDDGRDPDRVVFVGAVRHVKGLDVLVRALPHLIRRRPAAHLVVVGDPFFRQYRKDEAKVQDLIRELGLEARVEFTGRASPPEVAQHMGRSAVLAVPSRRETFAAVIVEALATGTPVVATRCGGPDDIVNDGVGRLVPVEDPEAFAEALADVMDNRRRFDSDKLRDYSLSRWGRAVTIGRLRELYARVLPSAGVDPRPMDLDLNS